MLAKLLLFLLLAVSLFSQSKIIIENENGEKLVYEFKGNIELENMKVQKAIDLSEKLTVHYKDEQNELHTQVFLGKLPKIKSDDDFSAKVKEIKDKTEPVKTK